MLELSENKEVVLVESGKEHFSYVDRETNESVTVSNVLVQRVYSTPMEGSVCIAIDMCAGGDAVLYTNGVAIEGTWTRDSLDSRTVFVDNEGNQFKLQPGHTWVQIADQGCSVYHE